MGLQEFAEATQAEHARLIDKLNASSAWPHRRGVINEMEALQQGFTVKALPLAGVLYPHQLVRTRPDHAVIIAVRSDINDTIARARALRESENLGKRISELKKLGTFGLPNLPGGGNMWLWIAAGLAAAIFLGKR